MTKMTYVEAIDFALSHLEDADVCEKLTALRGQIAKKRSASSKPTKRQVENEALKGAILDVLARADEGGMTIGEIAKVVDFEGATPNRVNALVKQLKDSKSVIRTEVKGKAYFTIA